MTNNCKPCAHPVTVLLSRSAVTEYNDCERLSQRQCLSCGASVTTIEVRVPEGMTGLAAHNRVSEFLAHNPQQAQSP